MYSYLTLYLVVYDNFSLNEYDDDRYSRDDDDNDDDDDYCLLM